MKEYARMNTETAKDEKRSLALVVVAMLAAVLLAYSLHQIFFFAPVEKIMGLVQKIFYFHVPAAWMMLLSTPLMAVGAIGYLTTRKDRFDDVADAAVELAILFGTLVLITGPLWGRKAWGVYWVWDVRLTSSMVLVLTLVACKIVRGYSGAASKQIAAGLSVLAVLNSIFVYVSVDIWRGTHPEKIVTKGNLAPEMKRVFWISVLAFHFLYAALFWARLRLKKRQNRVAEMRMEAVERGVEG